MPSMRNSGTWLSIMAPDKKQARKASIQIHIICAFRAGRLDCRVARAPPNDGARFPPTSHRHCERKQSNPVLCGKARCFDVYLFSLDCPMISCAEKLMPQVGKELPTKKLSD